MTRIFGSALCACFTVLAFSSAYADVWITHDQVLERRDENGAVVTTIAQAFGQPIGEITRQGEVDPATGNIWLTLRDQFIDPFGDVSVRLVGITPSGGEIWQKTLTGVHFFEPTFAIDTSRHGIWVIRPTASSTNTEAVLFDQTTGSLIARVGGLGEPFKVVVGSDGAVWVAVSRPTGLKWVRLVGTTQELNGYKVVGSTGPRHRTFSLGANGGFVAATDPADGSLYFDVVEYDDPSGETGEGFIVKYSAAGQPLWRKGVGFSKYTLYTDLEVDSGDGSVYFTTGINGGSIGHLSSLGADLGGTGFAEYNGSLAIDHEGPAVWLAEMPRVDDDLNLIAPMNLRKLDSSLHSLAVVPFPGVITVVGAVPASTLEISLDIQPQDKANIVSLVGNTEVRAALLSSAVFDPLQVDLRSIRFGTAGAVVRSSWTRDVNHDGVADLVVTFATQQTGIKCGDTSAPLTGTTHAGVNVHGTGGLRTQCP